VVAVATGAIFLVQRNTAQNAVGPSYSTAPVHQGDVTVAIESSTLSRASPTPADLAEPIPVFAALGDATRLAGLDPTERSGSRRRGPQRAQPAATAA